MDIQRVKLTIKHNMTTGKSWIVSVKHTDTVYPQVKLIRYLPILQ